VDTGDADEVVQALRESANVLIDQIWQYAANLGLEHAIAIIVNPATSDPAS